MISKTVIYGKNVSIGSNCSIGENVIIHNNVTIYDNTVVGDNTEILENAVIGRLPKSAGNTARSLSNEYEGTIIGNNCSIGVGVVVYVGTKIGEHVLLGDNCSIREECEIGDYALISRCVTINYNTKVGNRTKVMDNTHLTGNMIIEEDVFISVGVMSTNDNNMGSHGYVENDIKGAYIKRGCKIGANAIFLPKVVVGENTVVGAGSVVTKDIPSNKLVMGVPAKIIKDVD